MSNFMLHTRVFLLYNGILQLCQTAFCQDKHAFFISEKSGVSDFLNSPAALQYVVGRISYVFIILTIYAPLRFVFFARQSIRVP